MALDFTLSLKELPVTLRSAIDGAPKEYVLRELTGKGRDAWNSSRIKKDKRGNAVLVNGEPVLVLDGHELDLLAECVFDDTGALVSRKEIAGWPSRVVEKLAEEAQALSGIGAKEGNVESEASVNSGIASPVA